jgi:hypothetical protein
MPGVSNGLELLWVLPPSWLDNSSWLDAWNYVDWERFESIKTKRGFGGFVPTFVLKQPILKAFILVTC